MIGKRGYKEEERKDVCVDAIIVLLVVEGEYSLSSHGEFEVHRYYSVEFQCSASCVSVNLCRPRRYIILLLYI